MDSLKAFGYVIAFLIIQAIAQTIVMGISMLISGSDDVAMSGMDLIISSVLCTFTTIVVFYFLRWTPLDKQYLLTKPWIVICWSVVAALGVIIPSLFLQQSLPEFPDWMKKIAEDSEETFQQIIHTRGGYLVIALLAPIAEEVVFRGAALRKLLEWKPDNPWLMIALSALFFAVAHLNPAQMPHAFLMGLLLGWMYWRTGSIVPAIAFHWTNNTAAYILMLWYPNSETTLYDILGQRALLAVAFSLCIFLPALFQLHLWMKKSLPLPPSEERGEASAPAPHLEL